MKKLLLATITGLALSTSAAMAADLARPMYKAPPAPPPEPTMSWTGCYIDGGGGYGMSNLEHSGTTYDYAPATSGTINNGGRGWLGRFGGGCDYQMTPSIVVGAFGDYDFADIHGTFEGAFPIPVIPPVVLSGDQKERSAWAVGGRIGYLINPALLSYFDAGYTQASWDSITMPVPFGLPPDVIGSQTYHGWFLGSGFEYALNNILPIPGLFLRTEYRYSSYDSETLVGTGGLAGAGNPNGFNETAKPYVQTITTSLVWRFNWLGH
jgi:outer membrane immunogenic protein